MFTIGEVPNFTETIQTKDEDWEQECKRMEALLQSGFSYQKAEVEVRREATALLAADSHSYGDYVARTARLSNRMREKRMLYEAEKHFREILQEAKALIALSHEGDFYSQLLHKKTPWEYIVEEAS